MVNKSFTAQYVIKARDAFSKQANDAAKAFGKFNKQSGIAKKSAKALGNAFKVAGASIVGAITSVVFVGGKFETAMADMQAITGATGKDFNFLRNEALKLARDTVTSQTEVANVMKLVASAKPELLKNIPALTKMTASVLLLKNAGVDSEIAANAVAGGLNAFGKGAKFANKFVNILAAGSKFGSSEIRDTAEAVKIAGPGARAAGLSFLQLNAAIQTTARGNIKGTQAGTALNAIFGRLRRTGIDFQKIGLEKSFLIVKKRLESIKDPTARAKAEAKLFGEEHAKVGLALLNNVKLLGQFERDLSGTNVATEQAKIRLQTFSKALEKIKIIGEGVLTKVFIKLAPKITDMANKFGVWFDQLNNDDLQGFVDILSTALDVMKGIASFTGGAAKAFSNVGQGIGNLAGAAASGNLLNELFGDKSESLTGGGALKANGSGANKLSVDANVNVGLDKGLKQTAPASVSTIQSRNDTGMGAFAAL